MRDSIRVDRRRFLRLAGTAALGTAVGCAVSPATASGRRRREMESEEERGAISPDPVTLFLCGDVMTGRGVDQVLPHSVDPALHESYVRSARTYVRIAEEASGPIPDEVGWEYPWGDALEELARVGPAARIVNLETAATTRDEPWPGKGIHYRMHPGNVPLLTAAGIDCCTLANNHVLDWGRAGLAETLEALRRAGIATAGAGTDAAAAGAPAVLTTGGGRRVLVLSCGFRDSGIPADWRATAERSGVRLLPDLSATTARRVAKRTREARRPGDLVVVSIHWGSNWGYDVPTAHTRFAHALVDAGGADVVHGHSSHHPRPLEVYRGRPILYGCGDFLNDYEGIGGHERFRGDLVLMYFPTLDPADGTLRALEMTPLRIRRFRLHRAGRDDARWLADVLTREGEPHGTRVELTSGTPEAPRLALRWSP